MTIFQEIQTQVQQAFPSLFGNEVEINKITINETPKEFIGDITLVVFPLLKLTKKNPEESAKTIGEYLVANNKNITAYNIIKGFLNLEINNDYWINYVTNPTSQISNLKSQTVLIEYSSPNTNKPLHLGHVRNNVLGFALAGIYKANGYKVIKANLINDRGIHICKSMLAWQKYGNGETPENTGIKGDKLVGKYYVEFDKILKEQTQPFLDKIAQDDFSDFDEKKKNELIISLDKIKELEPKLLSEYEKIDLIKLTTFIPYILELRDSALVKKFKWKSISKMYSDGVYNSDQKIIDKHVLEIQRLFKPLIEIETKIDELKDKITDIAKAKTPILQEAQAMLLKWENGDEDVMDLWKMMNSWVYAGFDITYKNLGVDFDKYYYESNTYLLGKDSVEDGLQKGVFFKKEDGSVWIDLTADGLDQKLVLRADGTSVYITQDIGTADLKYQDFKMDTSIYVVGNEQDYHFKVLKLIMQKLGRPYANGIQHFSYGMVDLPSGKMKSREGTVVDADDLIDDMIASAKEQTEALGKIDGFTEEEKIALFRTIGLGALKFFLLRVDPKKRILFDPKESIDLHGYTGPFVQYTYARTRSILRRVENNTTHDFQLTTHDYNLHPTEKELIKVLYKYDIILADSCKEMNPAKLIDYSYEVAKTYNKFYNDCPILAAELEMQKNFRLQLTEQTGNIIKKSFEIVGIEVPERM
jgi:arginyl-tRNA synthetase